MSYMHEARKEACIRYAITIMPVEMTREQLEHYRRELGDMFDVALCERSQKGCGEHRRIQETENGTCIRDPTCRRGA